MKLSSNVEIGFKSKGDFLALRNLRKMILNYILFESCDAIMKILKNSLTSTFWSSKSLKYLKSCIKSPKGHQKVTDKIIAKASLLNKRHRSCILGVLKELRIEAKSNSKCWFRIYRQNERRPMYRFWPIRQPM